MCYDYLAVASPPDLRLVTVTPANATSEQRVRTLITRRTQRRAGDGVRAIAA